MAHILSDTREDTILCDVPHQQVGQPLQEQVVEPCVQVAEEEGEEVQELMVEMQVMQELLQQVHFLRYNNHHHTMEDRSVGTEDDRKSQVVLKVSLLFPRHSGYNNPTNIWEYTVVHRSDDIFHLL